MPPQSTVLLTTVGKPKTPRGFSRLYGGQRPALQGQNLVPNHHCQLPIGSAGVLVGQTVNRYPVYMPFDDVDVSINLGDAQTFTQFAVRSAAAGGIVTVGPHFEQFAGLIGAHIGPVAKIAWPNATTYLARTRASTRWSCGTTSSAPRGIASCRSGGCPRRKRVATRWPCRGRTVSASPGTAEIFGAGTARISDDNGCSTKEDDPR
ncbi:ESX-1 secretion system EccE1 domain protein [Mycobacterium kansasii 824]|nr:ESX-1 secretion system EccE1 domain protein [Mycobacterium kansasii 824]